MKTLQVIGSIAMLTTVISACGAPSGTGRTLAITHARVLDLVDGRVWSEMTVVVSGDRIVAVGADATTSIPSGAAIVDAAGGFLIPGLWDMHVHTFGGRTGDHGRDITLPLLVANGVTGVRDMGSDLDAVLQVRDDIAARRFTGPRMVVAGPMLSGPKAQWRGALPVASADDGRRAVASLSDRGVDFVKVQSSLPRDAYFAVAEECRRRGLPLVGHVPAAVRAGEAIDAQHRTFEHLIGVFEGSSTAEEAMLQGPKGPGRFLATYDEQRERQLAAKLSTRGVWQTPTLFWERGQWLVDKIDPAMDADAGYAPLAWRRDLWPTWTADILKEMATDPVAVREAFVQHELQIVGRLHRAGVAFLAGTDAPAGVALVPGVSLHHELARFVAAGLTPLEALQTATVGPARFLGREGDFGSVTAGKLADLLLLDADPTQDIANTRGIRAVVLAGRFLSRGDLDAMLRQVRTVAND